MKVLVKKSRGFQGEIPIPGDKSISHRAAFIGSLASETTEISNFLFAGDCQTTLYCLQKLGVEVRREKDDRIVIQGKNLFDYKEPADILNAENSGTTARFLLGLLSGQNFFSIIKGDSSLQERPMKRIVEPLGRMGARIDGRNGGNNLPLAVRGQKLKGIRYRIPVASAQLKSSLILASLLSEGETELEEPVCSRDHTERMLHYFGAVLAKKKRLIKVKGRKKIRGQKIVIPGDFSSAAFFIAAATLVENSSVVLPGVGINPTRTGFLEAVKKMGGRIKVYEEKTVCSEPTGMIAVSSGNLKGIEIKADEVPTMIDEIPLVALLGTQAEGKTVIRGASELKVKESDRLKNTVNNFRKLGVEIEELKDGIVVEGPQKLKGAALNAWGDHRIAMTMAVAGLKAEGQTEIDDFGCHKISFPDFYALLQEWNHE